MSGKIIAVANQKGGVGKTTTTVNLSACLAALGKRVLTADIDPQGNATSGLGIDRETVGATVYDLFTGEKTAREVMVETPYFGLKLLPADISLSGAEIELVSVKNREFLLKEALADVKDDFDFIFIDCPPSLGLITLNGLVAADTVLMPVQCEYYALEGVAQLTNTVNLVKKSLNPALELEGVCMTMFDGRTNLSIQVVEEVKKAFGRKMFRSVIPRNVRLSEAPSFGEPIIVFDKTAAGAQAYENLAKELLERNA